MRKTFVVLIIGISLTLLSACSAPEQETGNLVPTSVNLLPLYQQAFQFRETGLINLSRDYTSYYLLDGWANPHEVGDPAVAWVTATGKESILRYNVYRLHDRWLTFTAKSRGTHGGLTWQELELLVGDQQLARVEITPDEKEFSIRIPRELQQEGENFITFRFSVLHSNSKFMGIRARHAKYPFPYVAAYFKDLTIRFGDDSQPLDYQAADDTLMLRLVADDKYLSQQPNSRISYAFDIPAGGTLSFAGAVQSATGNPETLTVKIRLRSDDAQDYREVWSDEFRFGADSGSASFEDLIDLKDFAGKATEIQFDVSSSQLISDAVVVWRNMQLEMLAPEPVKAETKTNELAGKIRNVVFIVLDAARPDRYGVYGSEFDATTNIDAFSNDALVFKDAVVTAPYTLVSISSLFSGMLPEAHGVRKISQSYPKELDKMPDAFKRAGFYTLALVGNQFITPKFGLTEGMDNILYLRNDDFKSARETTMDLEKVKEGIAAAAARGKPAFIYVHFLPPHWPYNPPEPYDSYFISGQNVIYKKAWQVKSALDFNIIDENHNDIFVYHRRYLNNLRYGDYITQYTIDQLKENGLFDDSLVIVTSDHGEAFGENKEFGHNTAVYDTMIKIPLIVSGPGINPGVVEQQVGLIDFFPTLRDIFGLETEEMHFQGRSLVPLLTGGDTPEADFYYARAIGAENVFMVRGSTFKYIHDDFSEYLFDFKNDPLEKNNLISKYPVLARVMRMKGFLQIAASATLNTAMSEDVTLSKEEEEELRNLGYIQ